MAHHASELSADTNAPMRLDKWLWAARFFKTRGLAQDAIESGRVLVGGSRVKIARIVRVGEQVTVRVGETEQQVIVQGLSAQRGPAPLARELYCETDDSIKRRQDHASARQLAAEPAWTIEQGRPTKRDRRQLDRLRGRE